MTLNSAWQGDCSISVAYKLIVMSQSQELFIKNKFFYIKVTYDLQSYHYWEEHNFLKILGKQLKGDDISF